MSKHFLNILTIFIFYPQIGSNRAAGQYAAVTGLHLNFDKKKYLSAEKNIVITLKISLFEERMY